jgi:hypothetical protein
MCMFGSALPRERLVTDQAEAHGLAKNAVDLAKVNSKITRPAAAH